MKKRPRVPLFPLCLLLACPTIQAYAAQQKDYLTAVEADKIRDAENDNNERIRLFLTFAEDRLKKFQYELGHPSSNRHGDMLNSLLNAYIGCVDDAADLMQLGVEKQQNIRKGIDLMASRTKDFLAILEKISTDAVEIDTYKDNLDDAIEGTRDAMNDAEQAKKKVAAGPVRRKN
jgi:methyl-accepting chemotaxis protein